MYDRIRDATADDITAMHALIMRHGPNTWNYLPEDEVRAHLEAIAAHGVHAVVAEVGGIMVGFATYTYGLYPKGPVEPVHGDRVAYVAEVVVHGGYQDQGIGPALLRQVTQRASAHGVRAIYIDRHADNAPSGGMMRKAGSSSATRTRRAVPPDQARRWCACSSSRQPGRRPRDLGPEHLHRPAAPGHEMTRTSRFSPLHRVCGSVIIGNGFRRAITLPPSCTITLVEPLFAG